MQQSGGAATPGQTPVGSNPSQTQQGQQPQGQGQSQAQQKKPGQPPTQPPPAQSPAQGVPKAGGKPSWGDSPVSSGDWGDSTPGWGQPSAAGTGWGSSDPPEAADIGTWSSLSGDNANPLGPSPWGPPTTNGNNEIIVDSADKEAWPSIGDGPNDASSDVADGDSASVKSGSVISSSSNLSLGQGQLEQSNVSAASTQGQVSSAMQTSQGASSVWGTPSFTNASSDEKDIDLASPWGSTNSGTANLSSGWGAPGPITSSATSAVNNQELNMQGGGGDSTLSGQPTASSTSVLGWGSSSGVDSMSGANDMGMGLRNILSSGAQFNNGPQLGGGMNSTSQPGSLPPWQGNIGNFPGSGTGLSGLSKAASGDALSGWGGGNVSSSGTSVIGSSFSISTPSGGSMHTGDTRGAAGSDWGSTNPGGASGWGSLDPTTRPEPTGWGDPDPTPPDPNAGTEGWGHQSSAAKVNAWGSSNPRAPSTSGWGQSEQQPSQSTGWGEAPQDNKPNQSGWGDSSQKPPGSGWGPTNPSNPTPSGWGNPPSQSGSSSWGQAPGPDSKPSSGWASPSDTKPSASAWGNPGDKSAQSAWGSQQGLTRSNSGSAWGTSPNPSQSGWGGSASGAGPIGSNPQANNPQGAWGGNSQGYGGSQPVGRPVAPQQPGGPGGPGGPPGPSGPPQQQQQFPSTWAQAAGKNLPNNNRSMPGGQVFPGQSAPDPKEELIQQVVNSHSGWGKRPVRQDTSWEVDGSPQTHRRKMSSASSTGSGGEEDRSNHWNPNNNGTAIWETAKDPGPNWGNNNGSGGNNSGAASGGSSGSWDGGSDTDAMHWNGPPGENNSGGGGGNAWGGGGGPPQPPSNTWQNPGQNSWDKSNDKTPSNWGGPQGGSSWGDSKPDNQWGGGPPKDDNIWDKQGTNAWGSNNGNMGQWGGSGSGKTSSSSSWGEPDTEPTGWEEPTPPTNRTNSISSVDDGTGYWGDARSQQKPPVGWNAPRGAPPSAMPPQPMGGGRDRAPWGQGPPPPGKPGWGEPSPPVSKVADDVPGMWGGGPPPQAAKPGAWGDNQWGGPGPQGQRPKPPQSGWGGETGEWGMPPGAKKGPAYGGGGGGRYPPQMRSTLLQKLMDMGFKKEDAQNALISNNMNLESAIASLVASARSAEARHHPSSHQSGGYMYHHHHEPTPSAKEQRMTSMSPTLFAADLVAGATANKRGDMLEGGGPDPQRLVHLPDTPAELANPAIPPGTMPGLAQPQIPPGQVLPNPKAPAGIQPPSSLINQNHIQQKIIQHQIAQQQQHQGGLPGAAQPPTVRGSQVSSAQSVQQQLMHQQIVLQLRSAVQAGLLSPQLLNQQLTPAMLVMLQQLLQLQNVLQRLVAQQQVLQTNRAGVPPAAQRQQLEQLGIMIQKFKAEILQQQQKIAQQAQQQTLAKQQAPGMDPAGPPPPTVGGIDTEMAGLSINKPDQHPAVQQQNQSRLKQWKLPSPEKDQTDFNKAPGGAKAGLHQSASTPNLQNKDTVSSSSTGSLHLEAGGAAATSSTATWSASSAATTSVSTSTSSRPSSRGPGAKDDGGKALSSSTPDLTATSASNAPGSTSSSNNIADMIEEFVPGKPWLGANTKTVDDDPFMTPGSAASQRPLSVNAIKDEDLAKLSKVTSPNTDTTTSTWSSAFSTAGKGGGSGGGGHANKPWSTSTEPTSLGQQLWDIPSSVPKNTRPPPGLVNRSVSWAPGESSFGATPWGGRASNCLVLKNLTPQIDGSTLKTLCMQHGPLQAFYLNLNYGQAVVRYSSREEAAKAQKSLNTCVLGNTTIMAEFITDSEAHRLMEQGGAGTSTSIAGLWSGGGGGSTPNPQFQRSQSQYPFPSKTGTSHWNGANNFGGSSMWGSGGSLWGGTPLEDNSNLLPGDLLGGQPI